MDMECRGGRKSAALIQGAEEHSMKHLLNSAAVALLLTGASAYANESVLTETARE